MNHAGSAPSDDIYSVREIADAAGVSFDAACRRLEVIRASGVEGHFRAGDAARLVRLLASNEPVTEEDRAAISPISERRPASAAGLVTSSVAHAAVVAAIVIAASLGLMDASSVPVRIAPESARLVFLSTPGVGGGGGGGGLRQPRPARPAQRKAAVKKTMTSPVPEVRRAPPPAPEPRPAPPVSVEPTPQPPVVESPPPAPAPAVQAPVAPAPADPVETTGTLARGGDASSQGSGTGGGAGTGAGTGIGEGQGAGIGEGSEAGTGGGPYRAGAGIEPPRLRREVKPIYTDAARRRGLEGEVLVEIVVRRDGTVGDVCVLRRLGDGLDEKAVEAVRQWTFDPARRHGVAVDVIVEVSLQFTLR
jgi:TonB family protein